jgi:hypothetical protein
VNDHHVAFLLKVDLPALYTNSLPSKSSAAALAEFREVAAIQLMVCSWHETELEVIKLLAGKQPVVKDGLWPKARAQP